MRRNKLSSGGGEGGGAPRYQMDTHWQMAVQSGSGGCKNLRVVSSFGSKKGGRSTLN